MVPPLVVGVVPAASQCVGIYLYIDIHDGCVCIEVHYKHRTRGQIDTQTGVSRKAAKSAQALGWWIKKRENPIKQLGRKLWEMQIINSPTLPTIPPLSSFFYILLRLFGFSFSSSLVVSILFTDSATSERRLLLSSLYGLGKRFFFINMDVIA